MKQYHDLVLRTLREGVDKEDRTGVGTRSIFGHQMCFNLQQGFPLLTTKYTHFHAILVELLWFLRGGTNVKWLQDNGVHIWDEWADENGELGPVYGRQWRSWPGRVVEMKSNPPKMPEFQFQAIDQIANVVKSLRENPFSRRHIVTAWNPAEVGDMALPPCHTMFQFNVRPNKKGEAMWLDCQLYQRSGDIFLGVPFNIASYALLTQMIANITSLVPGKFIHTLGDAHIYKNHFAQVAELLGRDPFYHNLPRVLFTESVWNIEDYNTKNVELHGYTFDPAIKAPIAV